MTAQTRPTLKGYFNTGGTITESDMTNLIDSFTLTTETPAPLALFNVKDPTYGALGDGVAIDGTAIQAAIDAADAAGGGMVYIPQGTYLIDEILIMQSNVHLIGAGRNLVTIKAIDEYDPAYTSWQGHNMITQTPGETISGVELRGFTLDHNAANWDVANFGTPGLFGKSYTLSFQYDNSDITLRDIGFINPLKYCLHMLGSSKIRIYDVYIRSGTLVGGYAAGFVQQDGLHFDGCQNVWIVNPDIDTYGLGQNSGGDDSIAFLNYSDLAHTDDIHILGGRLKSGQVNIGFYSQDGKVCKNAFVTDVRSVGSVYGAVSIRHYGTGGTHENLHFTRCHFLSDLQYTDSNARGVFQVSAHPTSSSNSVDGLWVQECTFDGTGMFAGTDLVKHYGMNISRSKNVHLRSNRLTNWTGYDGLRFADRVLNFTVQENFLDLSTSANAAIGMNLNSPQSGTVQGNIVAGKAFAGSVGIELVGITTDHAKNIRVGDNTITGFTTHMKETSSGGTGYANSNRFDDNVTTDVSGLVKTLLSVGRQPYMVSLFATSGSITVTNVPAAKTEVLTNIMRAPVDIAANGFTQARLFVARVQTISNASAVMYVEYSTDSGSTFVGALDGSAGPTVSLFTAGLVQGTWVTLSAALQLLDNVIIRCVTLNGDGAADPVFTGVHVLFR
jgi:hypothetical protein